MDAQIKNSIDIRKNTIFDVYNVDDKEMQIKIENLFLKIEELANECKDVAEFETKFTSSKLNKEYMDLFSELPSKCTLKNAIKNQVKENFNQQTIANDIKNEIEFQSTESINRIEAHACNQVIDKVSDIPVIGDVIQAKKTFDVFKRFKRK